MVSLTYMREQGRLLGKTDERLSQDRLGIHLTIGIRRCGAANGPSPISAMGSFGECPLCASSRLRADSPEPAQHLPTTGSASLLQFLQLRRSNEAGPLARIAGRWTTLHDLPTCQRCELKTMVVALEVAGA